MKKEIYVKVKTKAASRERQIRLGQVAEIWCNSTSEKQKWEKLLILEVPAGGKHRYVISAIQILSRIQARDPQIQVTLLGEADVVVDCRKKPKKKSLASFLKTAIVCLITFTGAAFAIMTFNNDVDVSSIFQALYPLITGTPSDGRTVLEWTYCLGLFLGIVVFFNHISKLRVSDDPTPLEVQMRMYEEEVNAAIIENDGRKEDDVDVL